MYEAKYETYIRKPFCNDYKVGYIINGSEGRRIVMLIAPDGTRKCTAYARYLMSVKLGRYLDKTETVDHINEDKSDDRIDNLQILSNADNIKKHAKHVARAYEHGTYRSYRHGGCRCDACKDARKAVMNKYYAKNKDKINSKRRARRRASS